MKSLQVNVVGLNVGRGVAAVLADVEFVATLLVAKVEGDAVQFARVRLQRAALREALLTVLALVRSDAWTIKSKQENT